MYFTEASSEFSFGFDWNPNLSTPIVFLHQKFYVLLILKTMLHWWYCSWLSKTADFIYALYLVGGYAM